jgi:hypothetical protein
MSSYPATHTTTDPLSSGTPVGQEESTASNSTVSTASEQNMSSEAPRSPTKGEETLESHEVIELQTFSERKAWIEEKIRVCAQYLSKDDTY